MKNEDKTIFIVIFILLLVGLVSFYYSPKIQSKVNSASPFLASILPLGSDIQFAGYHWAITSQGNLYGSPPHGGGAGGTYNKEDFITLTSYGSGYGEYKGQAPNTHFYSYTCMITDEEISNIDEFLIIWTGDGSHSIATGGCSGAHGGSNVFISLYDKSNQQHKIIKNYPNQFNPASGGKFTFKPELVKFMNNFDGTYTTYSTLGVGDVYIKDKTVSVVDMQSKHLAICAYASGAYDNSCKTMVGNSKVMVYNIITKRLETPVCKAGEFPLSNGSCEKLETILLARESAIYESLAEKIQRIEDRLSDREKWLQSQIDELNEILKNEDRSEQIELLSKKIEELTKSINDKEQQKLIEIQNLENSIESLKQQLLEAEGATEERIANEIIALQKQLELAKILSSDEIGMLDEQMEFYNNQLNLIIKGTDVRIEELENELGLTKTILEGIQSGEITPPPDVDIEEVVKKVLDKIEIQQQAIQRGLTDEEINELTNNEINSQFQQRFPVGLHEEGKSGFEEFISGVPIYVWIAIAIVVIFLLIPKKR